MSIIIYFKKFWQISSLEKALFIKGYFYSLIAFLMVNAVPLKFYYRLLRPYPAISLYDVDKINQIRAILRTMKRVTMFSFWHCNCLNRVITLKMLCDKFGIKCQVRLVIGNYCESDLYAHASLIIDSGFEYLALNKYHKQDKYLLIT